MMLLLPLAFVVAAFAQSPCTVSSTGDSATTSGTLRYCIANVGSGGLGTLDL
jgi:hypothetical protein